MDELFVERHFTPPLTKADIFTSAANAEGCFNLYKVQWRESLLALDGTTLLCRFVAPDAESLRAAFRVTDGQVPLLWAGAVHHGAHQTSAAGDAKATTHIATANANANPNANANANANVAVERRFAEPVELADISAMEKDHSWCLETRNVSFVRTFFANDRTRMICLYQAPDAEAVRQAQRQAGMPMERVWAFQRIDPKDLPLAG